MRPSWRRMGDSEISCFMQVAGASPAGGEICSRRALLREAVGSCPQGYVWTGSLPALGLWICQGVLDPEGSPRDPLPGSQGRAHGSGNGSK